MNTLRAVFRAALIIEGMIALAVLIIAGVYWVSSFDEPERECLQGFFLEELQPKAEQFGAFEGYLCGTNLKYHFVQPGGEVLNDGATKVPFD